MIDFPDYPVTFFKTYSVDYVEGLEDKVRHHRELVEVVNRLRIHKMHSDRLLAFRLAKELKNEKQA